MKVSDNLSFSLQNHPDNLLLFVPFHLRILLYLVNSKLFTIMSENQGTVNPIAGIYILDPSGIPLFARYYHGKINTTDSTLLGGFFSAIEVFVKTSLDEMLTDIGMTTSRYFFDRVANDYITVIIVSSTSERVDKETLDYVKALMNIISIYFSISVDMSDRNMMSLDAMIENMGQIVDNFVFEISMEFLDQNILEDMEYQLKSGQEVSDEFLKEIVDNINQRK